MLSSLKKKNVLAKFHATLNPWFKTLSEINMSTLSYLVTVSKRVIEALN